MFLGLINGRGVWANERYVTLVNPVRSRALWHNKTLKPIQDQYRVIKDNQLKATWLLQNDTLADKELVEEIKKFNNSQELGVFLEVSKSLALKSRIYFDEQRPWYDPGVIFLSAYEPRERKIIIDKLMTDFKNTFGYLPKSVGVWWIDGYSAKYLQDKYKIKTVLICADQKTTDKYGIWGQWWGYPYIPSEDNILVPGNSKMVVIQWAQRDLEKAYHGSGPLVSNFSLQANDYTSQKLDTKYFIDLAEKYLKVEKLGQITVGLETGIESVGREKEYEKQLKWIVDQKINNVTMSEFADKYRAIYGGKNPEKVVLGGWILTPKYRENKRLGERSDYQSDLVFADNYQKDTAPFLNRVYEPKNLIKKVWITNEMLDIVLVVTVGLLICLKFKIKGLVAITVLLMMWWAVGHIRYSVINGEKYFGFLVDNFRFVGITDKLKLVNNDLSSIIAKSMLKINVPYLWTN